jgi:hypothetical protein
MLSKKTFFLQLLCFQSLHFTNKRAFHFVRTREFNFQRFFKYFGGKFSLSLSLMMRSPRKKRKLEHHPDLEEQQGERWSESEIEEEEMNVKTYMWHFDMLNDKERTSAFAGAIRKSLDDSKVLSIVPF